MDRLPPPQLPRRREAAPPKATLHGAGHILLVDVVAAELPVRERVAARDHPLGDVMITQEAPRYRPIELIRFDWLALDRMVADQIGQ